MIVALTFRPVSVVVFSTSSLTMLWSVKTTAGPKCLYFSDLLTAQLYGGSILMSKNFKPSKKLVLLIHGIRTEALWHGMVKDILEENDLVTVIPLKYGYFDAFRFWFPFLTRKSPVKQLLWRIKDAIANHTADELVIIAHSFGTYAILQILKEEPTIRPNRMILCGSIIPRDFRWDKLPNRPEIINDCASRDIWPILAESTSWGYGASGVFGFGTPGIHDRYHDIGHSGYFREKFVKTFWYSWIHESKYVSGKPERHTPWWKSVLSILPVNWLIVIMLCVCFWFAIQSKQWQCSEPVADKTVALRATNGMYMIAHPSSSNFEVRADSREIGDWEKFTLEDQGCGNFSLKSFHNTYVTIDENGLAKTNYNQNGPTVFLMSQINKSNFISLQTIDRQYISAENGGGSRVVINANDPGKGWKLIYLH